MIAALAAIPLATVMVAAFALFLGAAWTEYRAHADQEAQR